MWKIRQSDDFYVFFFLSLETRLDDNKSTFITESSGNDHNIHVTGLFEFPITTQTECVPFGAQKYLINLGDEQLIIEFKTKDGKFVAL